MLTRHMRHFAARLLPLAVAVCLAGTPAVGHAQKVDSSSKVTVQAEAGKVDAAGNQQIVLKLTIAKGWHIYANPVGNDDYKGNETVVTVTGQNKPLEVKTAYPPGKVETIAGAKMRIYEGVVTLTTSVRRAAGDTAPLQATIQVNACNNATCLLPGQIKVNIPATK